MNKKSHGVWRIILATAILVIAVALVPKLMA